MNYQTIHMSFQWEGVAVHYPPPPNEIKVGVCTLYPPRFLQSDYSKGFWPGTGLLFMSYDFFYKNEYFVKALSSFCYAWNSCMVSCTSSVIGRELVFSTS